MKCKTCGHETASTKIIEFQGKKIEVELTIREKVKWKDLKIPRGWRLLNVMEGAYLYDNHPEFEIGKTDWEWIEPISQNNLKKGYVSSLSECVGGLHVDGNDFDLDFGYAFPVRFARDVKA